MVTVMHIDIYRLGNQEYCVVHAICCREIYLLRVSSLLRGNVFQREDLFIVIRGKVHAG